MIAVLFTACLKKEEESIKIGFIAGLSGKYSSLGNSVKNGVLLAFEEVDFRINNKKIVFIQKDDEQDKDIAKNVINELLEEDVTLIIGNCTSSMTKISMNNIQNKNVLLFSPTASSDEFSNIDDDFIRLQVSKSLERYNFLSKHLIAKNISNILLIYDKNNMSFSNSFIHSFEESFINNGGNKFVLKTIINEEYENILEKINSVDKDLIVIVANSIDASKLIQYLRINHINNDILCSGWSKTVDFIENGGKAVEGVMFDTDYNDDSTSKRYLDFVNKYKNRYKALPSVFAAQGYETAQVLIQLLEDDSNIKTLKSRIIKEKIFFGLQGKIIFNKFGDISRENFLMIVKNKKFIKID